MAYATGSGSFSALITALAAFAVSEGWTATSGDFPLTSPSGRIFGMISGTSSDTMRDGDTGTSAPVSETIHALYLDNTAPSSTTSTSVATIRCTQWDAQEWHFFSDPDVSEYIHVFFRQSNGFISDLWNHFSLGELDLCGMSHRSPAYVGASGRRMYTPQVNASGNSTGANCRDYNCGLFRGQGAMFGGCYPGGYGRGAGGTFVMRTDPPGPNNPLPDTGWWTDSVLSAEYFLATATNIASPVNVTSTPLGMLYNSSNVANFCSYSHPIVGQCAANDNRQDLVLGDIPIFVIDRSKSNVIFLGRAPGIRICLMTAFNPGDEVTIAGDVWKIFPVMRKTGPFVWDTAEHISSYHHAYAVKKVV